MPHRMVDEKKLRILHVTFNMDIGGAEQVIKQLVQNANKTQYDMSVLCLENNIGPLGKQLLEQGIEVVALNRKPGFDVRLIRSLRAYIQNYPFDILHCHQYTPYVYGMFASLFTDVEVIFTEHGRFHPDRSTWKRKMLNPLLSLNTAAITSISQATKEALVNYENFPRRRIEVIYNGIEDSAGKKYNPEILKKDLGIKSNDIVLGTISRLDSIKNITMMISAFQRVLTKFPNSKLLIVGDGPERRALEDQVKTLGIAEQAVFTGYQLDPQRYLNIMELFLLSSFSEGTSMTLLEAMSYAKPVVVTNVGGNPEIVKNGETGVLVASDDHIAFSDVILRLLNDGSLMMEMGVNARKRFESIFTVEKMIKSYSLLYRRIARQCVH